MFYLTLAFFWWCYLTLAMSKIHLIHAMPMLCLSNYLYVTYALEIPISLEYQWPKELNLDERDFEWFKDELKIHKMTIMVPKYES